MEWQVYITDEDYAIAAKNGISKDTVWQRINRSNWTKENAITKPLKKQRKYRQWEKICKRNGINWNTFLQRVNRYGWDAQTAATTPTKTSHEVLQVARSTNTVITEEHLKIMTENGVCRRTVYSRTFRGWSLERAISTPPLEIGQAARKMKKSV